MRTAALFAIVIVIGAAVGIGLKQATRDDGLPRTPEAISASADEVREKLAGSPAPLAALHAQADELLPGGNRALRRRLAELRGHPVVVNVWASWCGPCNEEAPTFQRVSLDRGREVAFVGVNLKDARSGAERFLRRFPASFPSYEDPDGEIFNAYRLAGAPATIFYTPRGERAYTRQGPYRSVDALERDIDRYALGRNVTEAR
jgi:thiol-disulfide isomerase/thioredoxin